MCRGLKVYYIQINSIATQVLPVLPPPIVCIFINQFHSYCKYECEFLNNQKLFLVPSIKKIICKWSFLGHPDKLVSN